MFIHTLLLIFVICSPLFVFLYFIVIDKRSKKKRKEAENKAPVKPIISPDSSPAPVVRNYRVNHHGGSITIKASSWLDAKLRAILVHNIPVASILSVI
jgi:hypothetical protein